MKQDLGKLTLDELREMRETRLAEQHSCLEHAHFGKNGHRFRELASNLTGNIRRIEKEIDRRIIAARLSGEIETPRPQGEL